MFFAKQRKGQECVDRGRQGFVEYIGGWASLQDIEGLD